MRRGWASKLNAHFGLSTSKFLAGKPVSFISVDDSSHLILSTIRRKYGSHISLNDLDAEILILDGSVLRELFYPLGPKLLIFLTDLDFK